MKTNMDITCLHLAVQYGNIQLVEYILMKFTGENLKLFINEQSKPFGTSLHIAAKFCDSSMIHLLYQYGADPTILNSNEQSPLHIASTSNRLSIIQELYNLTKLSLLEIKDKHGQTALSVTTHPDIIDQLIIFGADISSLDNNYMNAIMIAVLTNQIDIVNRLLLSINNQLLSILDQIEKTNDRSIFLLAVQNGSIDMCSLLLTHSYIRWNTIDKQRMNIFHIAAQNNHYELIKFLYGKTPLHIACERGYILCIQILFNYGGDVLIVNHLGQLPLHSAIQNGHSQCVDLLIKFSRIYTTEFQTILLRKQSPLIIACQYGFIDIVKLLISYNIGINFNDNKEDNPLEIAIKYRQIEIIHILLEHPYSEYWLMSIRNNH